MSLDDRSLARLVGEAPRLDCSVTVTIVHPEGESEPSAIVAVMRDETERWRERRELRAEVERLRAG